MKTPSHISAPIREALKKWPADKRKRVLEVADRTVKPSDTSWEANVADAKSRMTDQQLVPATPQRSRVYNK